MYSLLLRIIFLSGFAGILVGAESFDDIEKMIVEERYPVEKHYVTTPDNYILGLHRIPTGKSSARVVLLMHGLLASGADYLVFGRNYSLGYVLSDAGYDVWLGNARGTTFSRSHRFLDPDTSAEFWDFSFHEIGIIDMPTIIDYILNETGQARLDYVGHSQGCTAFFVMAALRPVYMEKVASMHAMAPAVFLPNSRVVFQFVLDFMDQLEEISRRSNLYEVSADHPEVRAYLSRFSPLCQQNTLFKKWCVDIFFTTFGTTVPTLSKRMARHMLHNSPNIASIKQLVHFGQIIKSNRFQQFDYRETANLQIYGQPQPPDYNLSGLNASLFVYYGMADLTTPAKGIQILVDACDRSDVRVHPVLGFNHLDFMFSKDARTLVYERMIKNMNKM